MKDRIHPSVMGDVKGNAEICGVLKEEDDGFYCIFLERKLEGFLGPIRPQNCPLLDMRSRTCEVLKPIQSDRFSSEKEDTSFR